MGAIICRDGQVKVLSGFEREYSTGLFWETTHTSSRRHSIVSYIFKVSFLLFPAGVPCCESGISSTARGSIGGDSAPRRQTLSLWAEGYV